MTPRPARVALALLLVLVSAAAFGACGTNVDLGGSSDAGSLDAGPPGAQCAPCSTGSNCASATCAQFAGDLYCGTLCSGSGSNTCTSDETCTSVTSTSGGTLHVCVPTSDACSPAAPPAGADGATLDHCGPLNGPTIASSCQACGKYSDDCQANGCYGGYWCDETIRDCQPPPTSCN